MSQTKTQLVEGLDLASAPVDSLVINSSGRVGIGETSPSGFSSGAANLVISAPDGSNAGLTINNYGANLGSIFFANGTSQTAQGRIRYDHSADSLSITTNGNSSGGIFVDSSQRVGIGTTSPGALLNTRWTGSRIGSTGVHFATSHGDSTDYTLLKVSNSEGGTDAATKFLIRGDGRVGVGNALVVGSLNVRAMTNGNIHFRNITDITGSGPTGVAIDVLNDATDTVNDLALRGATTIFRNASSETLRIDSSGRLLVGTASEFGTSSRSSWYSLLQIRGNTSGSSSDGRITLGTGATVGSDTGLGSLYFCDQNGGDRALIKGFSTSAGGSENYPGYLTFWTNSGAANPTERMRIDSSGRLLVGTASTSASTRLVVQGNSASSSGTGSMYLRRGNNAIGSGANLGEIVFSNNVDQLGAYIQATSDAAWTLGSSHPTRIGFFTTASGATSPAQRMEVSSGGRFYLSSTWYSSFTTANAANVHAISNGEFYRSTSSLKYKTDVETIQDSYSDAILNIRPVWYRSLADADNSDHSWWGFIAEEVAEVDPRLVQWKTVDVTYDEKGSPVETPCDPEPEGVAYDRFVPHLLNLIKRQQQAIETLEAKVAALEAN